MPRKAGYAVQCSVEGCTNIEVARSYCNKHYLMWKRYGDPMPRNPQFGHKTIPPDVRLREMSEKVGDCWLWPYGSQRNGYAHISVNGKTKLAHRAAYELFVGPIPEGMTIDHVCHNNAGCDDGMSCLHRRCVNPAHLEAVSMRTNLHRSPNRNEARTHCPAGHPYEGDNLVFEKARYGLTRRCRTCRDARNRRTNARRRKTPCP